LGINFAAATVVATPFILPIDAADAVTKTTLVETARRVQRVPARRVDQSFTDRTHIHISAPRVVAFPRTIRQIRPPVVRLHPRDRDIEE
jgi:hypothetical protein